MSINYISTRGHKEKIPASKAIIQGIAPDEGLYVPEQIPQIELPLEKLVQLDYKSLAAEILKLYLTDFSDEELQYCINNAYDNKFDTPKIAPLKTVGEYHFLELFHGRTLAFKDMALSILPYLMKVSAKKQNIDKKIAILTATSGDTGKAALDGFAEVEDIDIMVFYPCDGVSDIQKLQMTTQHGSNVCVVGIKGNFDDAQTAVKQVFTDRELCAEIYKRGRIFSSANSINIGRLVPQIVYYFYAYAQMVQENQIQCGEAINFTVPTGNFGNILAGYYAKGMGLPVNKLVCASNPNKVLYDFFSTGVYDKNRAFVTTASPSMDILISSNLERLLYDLSRNTATVHSLMSSLKTEGSYSYNAGSGTIAAAYAEETETFEAIKLMYDKGYTMDTHTAVAFAAYQKLGEQEKGLAKNVIVSTASPYKFADAVIKSITGAPSDTAPYDSLVKLSELSNTPIPEQLLDLFKKEIRHKMVCDKTKIKEIVNAFLL